MDSTCGVEEVKGDHEHSDPDKQEHGAATSQVATGSIHTTASRPPPHLSTPGLVPLGTAPPTPLHSRCPALLSFSKEGL